MTLALIGGAALAGSSLLAQGATVQDQGLRITVLSQVKPNKLPRTEPAPIAVFVSGHIATPTGALAPQLQRMTIKVNRRGLLQSRGLPRCSREEIVATSSDRALSLCRDALVGSGRFYATVVFPDQRPYPTRGRLLIFNGRIAGKPVLFAHIYTQSPFASSFVITFALRHIDQGPYGTELTASLPQALGDWGFVDRIKLTLRRKYSYQGQSLSYFNANCPAPQGTPTVSYSLARASFYFSGHTPITLGVQKSCRVKK